MDNQNNPNNQQNGYTNFNNYQPTDPQNAQQPVPPQAGQQPIPPQPGQMPYQAAPVAQQKDNSTGMGIGSIILGVVSLFICPYIFGAMGVALGIAGLSKKKNSVVCWIGLIVSIIALIINIAFAVYRAAHPEINQQLTEDLTNLLGGSSLLLR